MKTESRVGPHWAKFKAQDEDGQWWYGEEPYIYNDTDGWVSDGKFEAGPVDCRNECWKLTLTKV